jgi:hypothetical protein
VQNEAPDDGIIRDAEEWFRKEQAQAMLDLFEEDRGRRPATLEEVREWVTTQNEAHLKARVSRRVDVVLNTYAMTPTSG